MNDRWRIIQQQRHKNAENKWTQECEYKMQGPLNKLEMNFGKTTMRHQQQKGRGVRMRNKMSLVSEGTENLKI